MKKGIFLLLLAVVSVFFTLTTAYAAESDFTISNGTITAYNGTDTAVIIPETINGEQVTALDYGVFRNNSAITSVTIPGSIKTIDERSFEYCTALTSVTLSEGLETIDDYAFAHSSKLASISLPSTVTTIGDSAFRWCSLSSGVTLNEGLVSLADYAFAETKIKKLTLPSTLESFGLWGFYNCTNMTTVSVNSNNKYFSALNGILYNKHQTEVVACPPGLSASSISLPSTVTNIRERAFQGCTKIAGLNIPEGVTVLNSSVIMGCSALKSMTIPESLTYINIPFDVNLTSVTYNGSEAQWNNIKKSDFLGTLTSASKTYKKTDNVFAAPSDFTVVDGIITAYNGTATEVVIPAYIDGVEIIGIGDHAFNSKATITSVVIPQTVKTIGSWAFNNLVYATKITLPDGITAIADNAFRNCKALSGNSDGEFVLPSTLETIGTAAFFQCSSLPNVIIQNATTISNAAFSECSSISYIQLPDSLTTIGDSAFEWCSNLTTVTIPKNVSSLDNAFYGCSSLTEINVDTDNKYYTSNDGVVYNSDKSTLLFCPNGKSGRYTVYSGTTEIADSAFNGCSSLTGINLPNNLSAIGGSAFMGCSQLFGITLGDLMTEISDYAFYGCTSLVQISIPVGVTAVGQYAFYSCDALETVYYGGSSSDWSNISIADYNDPLVNANISCAIADNVSSPVIIWGKETVKLNGNSNSGKIAAVLYDKNNNPIELAFYSPTELVEISFKQSGYSVKLIWFDWDTMQPISASETLTYKSASSGGSGGGSSTSSTGTASDIGNTAVSLQQNIN